MNATLELERDRLWLTIVVPIVVLTLVSLLSYGLYYGLQAVGPELVADLSVGQIVFVQYCAIAVVEWILALSIIWRLRRAEIPLKALIAPQGSAWRFRWGPAMVALVAFNLLTAGMMAAVTLVSGDAMSTYADLRLWQRLFLLALILATAPFCEELIWRGYVITCLEARGRRPIGAILISSLAFALIHGDPIHWLFTFGIGVVAAWYYTRERNLIPLIVTHAIADMWSFAWAFFLVS